jgi:hypothetical protein
MCFFGGSSAPVVTSTATVPTTDTDAVRARAAAEAEKLAAMSGTAGAVKTDLAPDALKADAASKKKVLLGV